MRFSILLCTLWVWVNAGVHNVDISSEHSQKTFMGIKILDQKHLAYKKIEGIKFAEISDLSYDLKTNILYLLSDKGLLYSFSSTFSSKIDTLVPLKARKLKNKRGKRFKKWKRDSEGLSLDDKGRLLISFEGKAKIAWFHKNSSMMGQLIKKYTLPKALKNEKNYRSINKSLESLTFHKTYGILTAAEWPLKKWDKKRQTIYSLQGKKWQFKAEDEDRSGIVAMEVMDDGAILVMERSYTGLLKPLVVTLKKVYLNKSKNGLCKTKVLAKMSTHKGWNIDNFEGLTRISKNRYLMVSDDGDNFFQKTLLIYFEVISD